MKKVYFNTRQLFRAFCKSQCAFHKYYQHYYWRLCSITKLPKYFIENPIFPLINQRITHLWSSPHARFLLSLYFATKQASPCCYNPLRATAGKSLSCLYLSALLQNKPLHVATILSVLLQVKVSHAFAIRWRFEKNILTDSKFN